MAILFNCPYCTASVKVPDSAAGKLGECPKCATKIRIPAVEIPPAATTPPVPPPQPIPQYAAQPYPAPDPTAAPESFDFSRLDTATPKTEAPRRTVVVKKPGGSGRTVGIVVMLALVVLAGVAGWLIFQNQPIYTAAVAGTHAPSGQGISVSVPWATLNVEQSRQPPVVDYFKRHQTAILSNILKIEIAASINGLEIRAVPLEGTEIVGVDPYANPDIKKFILAGEPAWDATRRQVLAQFGKDLCDNVLDAQLKGGKVSNISDYRDVVALNSLVRGLGRHVLAASDQKLYPCIFEDKEGKLYFVVPIGTRDLVVTEKTFEGQPHVLPSGFRLDVSVAPPAAGVTPIAPAAEPAPTAPVENKDESEKLTEGAEKPTEEMKADPAEEMQTERMGM